MAAKETVYTHGHHESVLRSHRWRTAENSAAHLLPYLQPATADALMPVSATGCSPLPVSSLPGWEIRYPVPAPRDPLGDLLQRRPYRAQGDSQGSGRDE
jgi:hypothetical protein